MRAERSESGPWAHFRNTRSHHVHCASITLRCTCKAVGCRWALRHTRCLVRNRCHFRAHEKVHRHFDRSSRFTLRAREVSQVATDVGAQSHEAVRHRDHDAGLVLSAFSASPSGFAQTRFRRGEGVTRSTNRKFITFWLLAVRVSLASAGAIFGLGLGGIAGSLLAIGFLAISGDPDPMRTLDSAFEARPLAPLALAIIATYLLFAVLGLLVALRASTRLVRFLGSRYPNLRVDD